MGKESGSCSALTLATTMHISSQPKYLTILTRTKIRMIVKMKAMPVAIAETARRAGPLLPSSLRGREAFQSVIVPFPAFAPELEKNDAVYVSQSHNQSISKDCRKHESSKCGNTSTRGHRRSVECGTLLMIKHRT